MQQPHHLGQPERDAGLADAQDEAHHMRASNGYMARLAVVACKMLGGMQR